MEMPRMRDDGPGVEEDVEDDEGAISDADTEIELSEINSFSSRVSGMRVSFATKMGASHRMPQRRCALKDAVFLFKLNCR